MILATSRTPLGDWSVLFRGTAEPIDDPAESGRLESTAEPLWITQDRPTDWVVVRPVEISGRRIPRFGE